MKKTNLLTSPSSGLGKMQSGLIAIVLLLFLTAAQPLLAATIVWNGTATTNSANNWSGTTWVGGVAPTSVDDVKFIDLGAVPGTVPNITNINNTVDVTTNVASLQYANSNNFHTTLIANGATLNITGANGLVVTTEITRGTNANNINQVIYSTITGVGGALVVNNTSANILMAEGAAAATTAKATLDLSGLDTFTANVNKIGVGTLFIGNLSQRLSGTFYLARTNILTLAFTRTNEAINGLANETTNALEIGCGAGNAGTSFLYLGVTNSIYADSIGTAKEKATATMQFNPAFIANNPSAYFRGSSGGANRVKVWEVGDNSAASGNNSSSGILGTNDFSGGTVDALVDVMILGRDRLGNSTGTANNQGVLAFTAGVIDVNTLKIGSQEFGNAIGRNPCVGIVTVNGSSAVLKVNGTLSIPFTANPQTNAWNAFGILNVTNGSVYVQTIEVGKYSTNASSAISLTNATLIVSNSLATTTSMPLTNFFTANSLLGLTVSNANARVAVGKLTTGGTTNLIQLNYVAVFAPASYPVTIPLVKYTGSILGNGYNFGLTNVPASAPGAYLSNNTANSSIDLILPTNPAPVITLNPFPYSGNPGDNVTTNFSVVIAGTSVTPLSYQWYTNGVAVADGPTGNGSTNFGATTATLGLTNAQTADSVSSPGYTVIITNIYGSATSSPVVLSISASATAPIVTGPANVTAIQGNNATFTASVSGNPTPAIQWQTNGTDIPGATVSSVTVNNVQYPADDGTIFSIITTNVAGNVTNTATLTVIVPPFITAQPANVVVTNTQAASFTVSATGVPTPGFKWKKNGTPMTDGGGITGSSSTTLSFTSVSPTDIATYSVTITNAAGTTNSANVTLTVNSTMGVTAVSPANGSVGICYDTPLAVTFSQSPTLRRAGTIKIYNINSLTPVDTIDLSLNVNSYNNLASDVQPRSIGGDNFTNYPVIITGNTAAVYPHSGVMTSNQTYYVTIDDGVFADAAGAYFAGITDTNAWKFSTKVGGPANLTNLVVVADNSGDFDTVQGAVDAIPAANTTPTLINIRNGIYKEIVNVKSKNNIIFRGQSRTGTIVGYPNNANLQATTHSRMAFKVNANDIALDNLTLTNMTPVGGSQAEALMIESAATRFILNNSTVASFQDTILANQNNSAGYFYNSRIQGQFDYIWGGGRLFFTNCDIMTLLGNNGATNTGNVTASRTDLSGTNGFSFMRCRFLRITNTIINTTMAGGNGTANGNVALVNCNFDDNYTNASAAALALPVILWEFGNSNLDNTIARTFGGTALTAGDGRLIAAQTSVIWLNGWVPQLAPNILTHPSDQSVAGGATATFAVSATGIPDPTYQWTRNGTNIPSATSSSLVITPANVNDAGTFAVVVTTPAGSVTSSNATLTVGNTAPSLTPVLDQTNNVGVTLNITNVATDPDVAMQTLTFTLLTGPAGSTVGASSGVFNWRATVSQANSVNPVSVKVADDGTPSLSATNNFTLTVNPLNQPSISSESIVGGLFTLTASGDFGPDYALQVSTNLLDTNWVTLLITNSPSSPFTLVDTNVTTSDPMRFYRLKVGPPLP